MLPAGPLLLHDKIALRRELRRQRASLSEAYRDYAASQMVRQLHQAGIGKPHRKVAAYLAVGSELSLSPTIVAMQGRGACIYLPLVPSRGRKMRFAPLDDPLGYWQKNQYGISEYASRKSIAAPQLDVVLIPLVGFDLAGGRLGQGGGYYDCTFAFRRTRHVWRKPLLVGIAFDCQLVTHLPLEEHDTALDLIITETNIYHPGAKHG